MPRPKRKRLTNERNGSKEDIDDSQSYTLANSINFDKNKHTSSQPKLKEKTVLTRIVDNEDTFGTESV